MPLRIIKGWNITRYSLELAIISTKDVNIRINNYLCTFLAVTASVILLVNVLVIR